MNTKTLLLLLLWLPMWGLAQTQQGYVKVIGRPDKPGQMLDHVVIQVKGMTNPVMSDSAGQFRLTIPGKGEGDPIVLLSVRKNGYELKDQGMVGRQFAYSSRVPLYITMVDTKQLAADKQRIEDNAYRVAEENYQKKLEIIEQLLAEAKISNENYRQELQKLADGYEKYVALIDGMAEHYAHTDYDRLDSIDYQISQCIENGELERADSLIRDLFDPVGVLQRNIDALVRLDEQMAQAQGIIDKANADMAAVLKQQDKDAEYLYQLYTIALSRFDFDKAEHYIETRAELDTTKWTWQFDAGVFLVQHNRFDKAEAYFTRTSGLLYDLMTQFFPDIDPDNADYENLQEEMSWVPYYFLVEANLASISAHTQRHEESIEGFREVTEFFEGLRDVVPQSDASAKASSETVVALMKMHEALSLMDIGRYSESESLFLEAEKALQHAVKTDPENLSAKAGLGDILCNLGLFYKKRNKTKKSEQRLQESLSIYRALALTDPTTYEEGLASVLDNIGTEATELEALEIYRRLAKKDPKKHDAKLSIATHNLAHLYDLQGRFEESEALYMESIAVRRQLAKEQPAANEPDLALALGNLGSLYFTAEDYGKCEPLYVESCEIYRRLAQKEPEAYSEKMIKMAYNLGNLYNRTNRIIESIPYLLEAYEGMKELAKNDIYRPSFKELDSLIRELGDYLSQLAPWLVGEARFYKDANQDAESKTYFAKALDIYRVLAKGGAKTYSDEIKRIEALLNE